MIDGIGVQSHFLERAELPRSMHPEPARSDGRPSYISELNVDAGFANDARHAQRLRDPFTMFGPHLRSSA